MKNKAINTLIKMGMPAGIKGFQYIVDALCFMASDDAYVGGNTITLYVEIASKNKTTPSRVERAIRTAFDLVRTQGEVNVVELYFGIQKPTNGNLLNALYWLLIQEE